MKIDQFRYIKIHTWLPGLGEQDAVGAYTWASLY